MSRDLAPSLAAVVGTSVRRLRSEEGITAEDLAVRLSDRFGLKWTRATVGALERGERDLSVAEFVLLLVALGVKPYDLLPGDERMRLCSPNDDDVLVEVSGHDVISRLEGVRLLSEISAPERKGPKREVARKIQRQIDIEAAARLEPEQKAARKLGVTAVRLSEAAFELWGHGLTAERERRAGGSGGSERTSPVARGHTTRGLIAELEAHLGVETSDTEVRPASRTRSLGKGTGRG